MAAIEQTVTIEEQPSEKTLSPNKRKSTDAGLESPAKKQVKVQIDLTEPEKPVEAEKENGSNGKGPELNGKDKEVKEEEPSKPAEGGDATDAKKEEGKAGESDQKSDDKGTATEKEESAKKEEKTAEADEKKE